MRKDTANWIALANYDMETARHMLETGRYLYVVFLCHLALEKTLKAHVTEKTQTVPFKTHDLIYLKTISTSSVKSIQPAYLHAIPMICNAL